MNLVVDTSTILKALMKGSRVRGFLLSPNHQFYIPEYAMEEVKNHPILVRERTGFSNQENPIVFDALLMNIRIVPSGEVIANWEEAESIMGAIDRKDVPFVAAALAVSSDGIWSDDKDFGRQSRIKVWSTAEIDAIL